MATQPNSGSGLLNGQAAALASLPQADTPRGGMEFSFRGETGGPTKPGTIGAPISGVTDLIPNTTNASPEQADPFQGLGPLLEDADPQPFKSLDGLVLRQELIALNHLAQDTHWTYVKLGYPWSTLTKEPNRDRYVQALPYGSAGVEIQAVPNKAWDLINKTTEALLVDFPQAECEPGDDTEEADAACDMADRFLALNASEQGTNDAVLFWDRVQRSLTCASAYIECWTDPTGNGYVPLQIPAHPQAAAPLQPLIGPDGMPTTSPILRYVTKVGPDGQPTEDAQFTSDATQAAPQWQPKLRAAKWQREHIRVFPETATVANAEKVIILGYCTLSEAKRRWPTVAQMAPEDLSRLTDWTPTRYLALLPPFQRGRWKLTDGRDKAKQGSSDERIMFYYHAYVKACPDYPKGADVVVTGAMQGIVLDRNTLSVEVEVPAEPDETGQQQPGTMVKETRCMEIPVVQVTLRSDPDEQDPSGRPYIEMIAGAIENNAHLAMSASEVIDKNLNREVYAVSTSPVRGDQREDSRATGNAIPIIRAEDIPQWGPAIDFEQAFFDFYEQSDLAINSIGSAARAANGLQNAPERSGKAIQLETANNNVALGGMSTALNNAYARWCYILVQQMMARFTLAEQVNYVGDDGIFKQQSLTMQDLAKIGKVTIKGGTGTLVTPDAKVQNLTQLAQFNLITIQEAQDAARPAYSRKLGLPPDPHEQRIERQITGFMDGPPSPEWVQQWQQYQQQLQAYQQQQQNAQLAAQNAQAQAAHATATIGAPPAPIKPVQTALTPPQMPWTPFAPLPTDSEPPIASMRMRRLSRLIDSAKFSAFPTEWQGVGITEYQRMAQVVQSVTPLPPLPKGVTVQARAVDAGTAAQEETSIDHPAQAPPPKPPTPAPGAQI